MTRYTAEELMDMKPEELDELVETLVIGGRPEPEIVQWICDNWLAFYLRRHSEVQPRQEVPEYSSCHAGFCLINEAMKRRGFEVDIKPDDSMGYSKDGGETRYAPWTGMLKTTAVAALLAVQGVVEGENYLR